jgi:biopolymer transport protein ExbB
VQQTETGPASVLPALLDQGGIIVAVIGVASFVALAVFLAKVWSLRAGRVAPLKLVKQVRDLVVRRRLSEALTLCRMEDSPLARVFLAGLRQAGKSRDVIKEFLLEIGRHEALVLQRGLGVLEVVAVIAPLLGLLGTVWGMIEVFRTIEVHGVGNAGALAGGIGTALYTTFAGLLVAIPVRVGHSYLLGRVDRVVMTMEEEVLDLLDLLAEPTQEVPEDAPASDPSGENPSTDEVD